MEQFCFDVFLFHTPYTIAQYCGLGYLFCLYIFQGIKFVVWDLPREKKRDMAKRDEVQKLEKAIKLIEEEEKNGEDANIGM